MRVNEYAILLTCVERGIEIGWQHGHEDGDSPAYIKDRMAQAVMDLVCESFTFPDAYEDE